jgi:hypothetical protein
MFKELKAILNEFDRGGLNEEALGLVLDLHSSLKTRRIEPIHFVLTADWDLGSDLPALTKNRSNFIN